MLLAIQKGAVVLFVLGWGWGLGASPFQPSQFTFTFSDRITLPISIGCHDLVTKMQNLTESHYPVPISIGCLGLLIKMQNLNSPKFSPTLINQLKCSCTFALDISLPAGYPYMPSIFMTYIQIFNLSYLSYSL